MSNYLIVVGKNDKVNLILNQFKISYGADESIELSILGSFAARFLQFHLFE